MRSAGQDQQASAWAGEPSTAGGTEASQVSDDVDVVDDVVVAARNIETGIYEDAAPAAAASEADTLVVTLQRCESCGSPALPGSALCASCCEAFSSVLEPETDPVQLDASNAGPPSKVATVLAMPAMSADQAETLAETIDRPVGSDSAVDVGEAHRPWWERPDASAAGTQSPARHDAKAFAAAASRVEAPVWSEAATVLEHPAIDPEPVAAAPAMDEEPRPWWERQDESSAEPGPAAAEPPFVPRGPATPIAVAPPYVAPPATVPHVSLAYSNGAPVDSSSRRTIQPRVARPLPTAPPPVRKGRGALISAAVVLACAAIGTPLAWKWSGLGATRAVHSDVEAKTGEFPAGDLTLARTSERTYTRASAASYASPSSRAPRPAAPVAAKPSAPAGQKSRRPAPVKAPVAAPVPEGPAVSAAALSTAFVPTIASAPAPPPPPPPQEDTAPRGPAFEVAQVDMRPEIASRVEAVMPAHLAARRVEDVVVLRVLVSTGGAPSEIRVLRRARVDAALDAAAIAAVRQWRFVPARKKGQAVRCWYNIGVSFSSTGE